MYKWSEYLRKYDVEFIHQSYDKITSISNNDFIYLDPPYADTNISIYLSDPFDDVKFINDDFSGIFSGYNALKLGLFAYSLMLITGINIL